MKKWFKTTLNENNAYVGKVHFAYVETAEDAPYYNELYGMGLTYTTIECPADQVRRSGVKVDHTCGCYCGRI